MRPKPSQFLSWTTDSGVTVQTQCDVIYDWTDVRESEVTEHSIEDGSKVNDHVAQLQPSLVVNIAVSQTPIHGGELRELSGTPNPSQFQPGGLFALTRAVGAAIDAVADAIGFGSEPKSGFRTYHHDDADTDPGNQLHDKLIEAWENAYLVKVSLGVNRNSMRPYDTMVVQRVQKVITEQEGEKSAFEVTLARLNIVKTEVTSLAVPEPLDIAKLVSAVSKGDKPPTVREDPDTARQRNKSFLKQLID